MFRYPPIRSSCRGGSQLRKLDLLLACKKFCWVHVEGGDHTWVNIISFTYFQSIYFHSGGHYLLMLRTLTVRVLFPVHKGYFQIEKCPWYHTFWHRSVMKLHGTRPGFIPRSWRDCTATVPAYRCILLTHYFNKKCIVPLTLDQVSVSQWRSLF